VEGRKTFFKKEASFFSIYKRYAKKAGFGMASTRGVL
jgi:hypothetical protein